MSSHHSDAEHTTDTSQKGFDDEAGLGRRQNYPDTPKGFEDKTPKISSSMWDMTPGGGFSSGMYGETPTPGRFTAATPLIPGKGRGFKSNWDSKTPVGMTPNTLTDATPKTVSFIYKTLRE